MVDLLYMGFEVTAVAIILKAGHASDPGQTRVVHLLHMCLLGLMAYYTYHIQKGS